MPFFILSKHTYVVSYAFFVIFENLSFMISLNDSGRNVNFHLCHIIIFSLFFSVKIRSDWKQDYTMVNFRINGANLNQTMLNNQGKLIYFLLTM